jgi:hypothetical protein
MAMINAEGALQHEGATLLPGFFCSSMQRFSGEP